MPSLRERWGVGGGGGVFVSRRGDALKGKRRKGPAGSAKARRRRRGRSRGCGGASPGDGSRVRDGRAAGRGRTPSLMIFASVTLALLGEVLAEALEGEVLGDVLDAHGTRAAPAPHPRPSRERARRPSPRAPSRAPSSVRLRRARAETEKSRRRRELCARRESRPTVSSGVASFPTRRSGDPHHSLNDPPNPEDELAVLGGPRAHAHAPLTGVPLRRPPPSSRRDDPLRPSRRGQRLPGAQNRRDHGHPAAIHRRHAPRRRRRRHRDGRQSRVRDESGGLVMDDIVVAIISDRIRRATVAAGSSSTASPEPSSRRRCSTRCSRKRTNASSTSSR